ncbi:VOC family protein [Flavobacterium sp.]|uniref:VOC family protein n=1 Tax=Flavobacterium sp. TaxID=239 RepID=UPI002B4B81CD|nr:VOC family protein [Flavobacterium sp.]HLP64616.1 VOC family protein [Flavobacterium sp.]
MKFQPIVPMIWTNKLQETVDFYCDFLGFSCGNFSEEWGWAAVSKDQCELMIAEPNEHTPFERPYFSGTFYIKTDDVDALWNQIKDKVKIAYDIEDFDWGMREFAIYDNNSYMIQFGQDLLR